MIYVMSDIHGNLQRFNSVMNQIDLKPEDTLYILGDVIDRYPDGIRILRKIMHMSNVKMLLGNHEHMMLDALRTPYDKRDFYEEQLHHQRLNTWYYNGGNITHYFLKHNRLAVREEIFQYLEALPLHYDVEVNGIKYKLVHAAPEELYSTLNECYRDMCQFAVWQRLKAGDELPEGYTLIFGHTPTRQFQGHITLQIWYGDRRIGIDCGAGFPQPNGYHFVDCGRLGCLRLDDMKEFYSTEAIPGRDISYV